MFVPPMKKSRFDDSAIPAGAIHMFGDREDFLMHISFLICEYYESKILVG